MHMQSDWEVLLNGNPQEIRQLCTWGHSINYFRLWGGVDDRNDCPNDDFLRIPRHPATQSTNIRPPVPRSSGQAVGAQRRRFALLV